MLCYIFKLDFDMFRLTIVSVTGYLNLRLLYNVSKPLTTVRKILVYSCFMIFYILLIVFNKILLIKTINFWSFMFMGLLIYANNYVAEFLEYLYDKFIVFYNKMKRSRSSNEKI